MSKKKFNPFYDGEFLISHEGSDERRMLVELYKDELIQLRSEINAVLKHMGVSEADSSKDTEKIKRAKIEGAKECAQKITKKIDPTLIAITEIWTILNNINEPYISGNCAIQKIKDYLDEIEIGTRLSLDMAVYDIIKEMNKS